MMNTPSKQRGYTLKELVIVVLIISILAATAIRSFRKSTMKSNSSKGGSGYNEFRFEDKQGSEEIFVQAQKDMNVTVLGKRTTSVTGDVTSTKSIPL